MIVVLEESRAKFDRRASRLWVFHVDLTPSLSDDLVPTTARETDTLRHMREAEYRLIQDDRLTRLPGACRMSPDVLNHADCPIPRAL